MKVRSLFALIVPMCACLLGGLAACEEKAEGEPEIKKDEAGAAEAAKGADVAKGTEAAKAEPGKMDAAKPAEPVAAKEPMAPPPAEVCAALVGAIKAHDEVRLMGLCTPSAAGALGAEGAKNHVMMSLASVTCGMAKMEGDNATVEVTGGAMAQQVPFVKIADMWKFDAAGYLAKYPPMDKAAKHKGKEAAKGKAHAPAHPKKHKK
jgi:hypothetical protein